MYQLAGQRSIPAQDSPGYGPYQNVPSIYLYDRSSLYVYPPSIQFRSFPIKTSFPAVKIASIESFMVYEVIPSSSVATGYHQKAA